MKRCPNCQSLMPDDVSRCIRCGFDSYPAARAAPAPAAAPIAAAAAAPAPKKGRLRSGWALAVQSCRVLMLNKRLLVFPLLSGLATVFVLATFVAGAWASGILKREEAIGDATAWVVLFGWYFANYFVIVFFNAALVSCAMTAFRGGEATLGGGLRAACARVRHIVAWALLAASVGVLLSMIEERVALVGKIVIALLGATWTVATYFVVPALVFEDLGPLDAAKRSVAILKKSWGESLVSNAGIGLATFLATLVLLVFTAATFGVVAAKASSLAVALVGAALFVAIVLLSILAGSALKSIALCALYMYATEGRVPQAFAGAGLEYAFGAATPRR